MKKFVTVLLTCVLALSFAFTVTACDGGDEKAFENYRTEQINGIAADYADSTDEKVAEIFLDGKAKIEAIEWKKGDDLSKKKAEVDALVSEIRNNIICETATIDQYAENGHFKQDTYFAMDTSAKASISGLMQIVVAMVISDATLKNELMAAETLGDFYTEANIYCKADGTAILEYKYSDLMLKYWKALDETAEKTEDVTEGSYTIAMTPVAGTRKYPVAIRSGSDDRAYQFVPGYNTLSGDWLLSPEVYHIDNTIQPPTVIPGQVEKNPYEKVTAGGTLEAKYLAYGDTEVETEVFNSTGTNFTKYKIWYPKDIATSNKTYPLIVMANGSGTPYMNYEHVFNHIASWGFIVIGNDEGSSGNGLASEQSLNFILDLNKDSTSKFYGKIDETKIGSAGHSQGGAGAINAVTEQPSGTKYKSIYSASAPDAAKSAFIKSDYDVTKINIPVFLTAAVNDWAISEENKDAQVLMQERFASLNKNIVAVKAQYKGIEHGDMLVYAESYMTAWFLYTLCGDTEAAKVFVGNNCELSQNGYWQNFESRNLDA